MDYNDLFNEEITVITYQHVDDPECFLNPKEILPLSSESIALLEKVKETFRKSGWEGDGELKLVWLPPFFYIPTPGTDPGQVYGTYIWHVKQHNNGTSFIGFYPDSFNYIAEGSELALQNPRLFDEEKK
jgi:hypothetical protein